MLSEKKGERFTIRFRSNLDPTWRAKEAQRKYSWEEEENKIKLERKKR